MTCRAPGAPLQVAAAAPGFLQCCKPAASSPAAGRRCWAEEHAKCSSGPCWAMQAGLTVPPVHRGCNRGAGPRRQAHRAIRAGGTPFTCDLEEGVLRCVSTPQLQRGQLRGGAGVWAGAGPLPGLMQGRQCPALAHLETPGLAAMASPRCGASEFSACKPANAKSRLMAAPARTRSKMASWAFAGSARPASRSAMPPAAVRSAGKAGRWQAPAPPPRRRGRPSPTALSAAGAAPPAATASGIPDAALVDAASLNQRDLRGTVVVTGAGPAGLAAAVALHNAGLPVVLLERAPGLSTTGSALGLWTNAWRALDALGAAAPLRAQHPHLEE